MCVVVGLFCAFPQEDYSESSSDDSSQSSDDDSSDDYATMVQETPDGLTRRLSRDQGISVREVIENLNRDHYSTPGPRSNIHVGMATRLDAALLQKEQVVVLML